MDDPNDFQLLLIPKDGSETRQWEISARRFRLLKGTAWATGAVIILLIGSWIWLAWESSKVPALESRVAELESEQQRVLQLSAQLEVLEAQYGGIRRLFGVDTIRDPADFWLPPADRPSSTASTADGSGSAPNAWPLSRAGFVTQALLDGAGSTHTGLDIAVPTDTWIRAAGGGVVIGVGEDPVYGNYVQVDHGDGLTTLYAHASRTVVQQGQVVRRGEVIAMSGNTGRSTAPHLHFEVRLDGEPVDPLEYVSRPG